MSELLRGHDLGLTVWTVYERPTDYPQGFIARRWVGLEATDEAVTGATLADVRDRIAERFNGTLLPRFDNDDPKIVETWI